MDYHNILQDVMAIATEAGDIALRYFRQPLETKTKASAIDIVTEADEAVEKHIAAGLLNRFPDHHLVGEEGGGQGASPTEAEYFWYVDPIDGTTNFANGIPYFSTSIALADANRRPLLGVVYDITRNDFYTAIRGQGATCNGDTLRVSSTRELIQAVVVTGFPHDRATNPDNNLAEWAAFAIRSRSVRCLGSAALDLAYVAAGYVDGFWERTINPWDTLAGMLLVQEAGGTVTDYAGGNTPQQRDKGHYVVSNGHLHQAMLEVIQAEQSGEDK